MANERIPRPEYPRPQFVRAAWLNLNGAWEFELDPGVSGEARGLASGAPYSRKINVPFCMESELSGVGLKDFVPCVWYRRSFHLPQGWNEKRVVLHFGAVDYASTVWVNGERAGEHFGGYSSFCFEITHLLKAGENVIALRAVDDTRSPLQPTGKQSPDYHSSGCLYSRATGVWQTVWLEAVSASYIKSARYYPNIDQGSVTIHANIDSASRGMILAAEAFAGTKKVGEAKVAALSHVAFTLALDETHNWQPGDPFLYDLRFRLIDGGKAQDEVESYFGLREVHIEGDKVLINGKPIFQRLVLDQGYYPDGVYTAPTDGALRHDIELAMAAGFNGARLHQKIFEARFLHWADKLGYLLWGEYPDWGIDHANPAALERVLPEWLQEMERDFNSPAIIGWCPFNETPGNQDPELIRTVFRVTKSLDPTRPVIDTSGYTHVETDIDDAHNYDQDLESFPAPQKLQRPFFISEYGGIWWNPGQADENAWGYGKRPKTEEEFIRRYKRLTEALLFDPRMFGFCYTQLTDVEQEVNGIYTARREPKFAPELLAEINRQKAAIEE